MSTSWIFNYRIFVNVNGLLYFVVVVVVVFRQTDVASSVELYKTIVFISTEEHVICVINKTGHVLDFNFSLYSSRLNIENAKK